VNATRRSDAERFLAGLGLAARAGYLRVGYDAVNRSLRSGEAAVVVVAGDAPADVRRRLARLADPAGPPQLVILDGNRLGRAVGRGRVVVMAVTEQSLGRRVVELAEEVEG
jgi:ribosomal protein L7Ae-like RNA K-turn-binding protein